jgi:hypothetical protein
MRAHFERSIEGARALISASSVASSVAVVESVESVTPRAAASSLSSKIAAAVSLPTSTPPCAAGALALAVHAVLLDSPCHLTCTGAADTPRGSSFASAHRPVPPSMFAPPGWDADLGPGVSAVLRAAHFRYQRHTGGRTGAATLLVEATFDEGTNTLRVRARVDRTAHGGGPSSVSVELPIARYTASTSAAGLEARAALAMKASPLDDVHLAAELSSLITQGIIEPLGFGRGVESDGPSSVESPMAENAAIPPRSHLLIPPRTGHWRGDFDADAFPDVGMGGEPGALLGAINGVRPGRDGSLVGPDHPIFTGRGRPEHPPGVLPGARFDPFMPPMPGGTGFGLGRGPRRGGGVLTGEPNPDHQRVPRDDAPPDIYW